MTLHITHPIIAPSNESARIAEIRAIRELAIMFADIAGSTGLYESLGDARAHRVVAATLQLMSGAVQACGGRVVKTVGDELMCAYPSADDAARGATAIENALLGLEVDRAERIAVRIGFNYGPVVEAGGDVFGDSVNVAARVAQIARPQQILTTASCVERLSPAIRSKARELQFICVRGRDSYVPVWELRWREEEDQTYRGLAPARQARDGSRLKLEFCDRDWDLWHEGDSLTMGRDRANHVKLEGDLASRDHARILVRNGKFVLIDHSTNGTYVRPGGGETMGMMHEEYVLNGSGEIGFGCIPAIAGGEVVRYSIRAQCRPDAKSKSEAPPEEQALAMGASSSRDTP